MPSHHPLASPAKPPQPPFGHLLPEGRRPFAPRLHCRVQFPLARICGTPLAALALLPRGEDTGRQMRGPALCITRRPRQIAPMPSVIPWRRPAKPPNRPSAPSPQGRRPVGTALASRFQSLWRGSVPPARSPRSSPRGGEDAGRQMRGPALAPHDDQDGSQLCRPVIRWRHRPSPLNRPSGTFSPRGEGRSAPRLPPASSSLWRASVAPARRPRSSPEGEKMPAGR